MVPVDSATTGWRAESVGYMGQSVPTDPHSDTTLSSQTLRHPAEPYSFTLKMEESRSFETPEHSFRGKKITNGRANVSTLYTVIPRLTSDPANEDFFPLFFGLS
jgi:hypothetical protein